MLFSNTNLSLPAGYGKPLPLMTYLHCAVELLLQRDASVAQPRQVSRLTLCELTPPPMAVITQSFTKRLKLAEPNLGFGSVQNVRK
jgi:hypothetical protein